MPVNRWLALLIAVATVLFAIGVSIEKSDTHGEPVATHVEGEAAEGSESAEAVEGAQPHEEGGETETLLGINLESTPLVVLAVIASLALGAGVWARPDSRALLTLISLAMLAFAVLDVREVIHQLDNDETGIALLAGLVALLHLAAAGLAWRLESAPDAATA